MIKCIFRPFQKLRKWEFEQEYRTQIFNYYGLTNEQRKVQLPSNAFKTIIIGSEMSGEDENQIREIIKKDLGHVTVIKAKIENGEIVV